MAVRPDFNQLIQFGVESTPGTGVTCDKYFSSTYVEFSPETMTRFFRAAGHKYPTTGVKDREWATGNYNGILSYNEIIYILASLFTAAAPAQIGATLGYTHAFTSSPTGADTRKTYTMQCGDAEAAWEVAFAAFRSLNIDFAEDGLSVSGDLIARAIDNTATLDSSPTQIAEAPSSVSDVDWYIDSTYSAVTGGSPTKWAYAHSGRLSIPSKLDPVVVQNTSFKSFRELVEIAIENATLSVTCFYDSQSRAIYDATNLDALPFRYIQSRVVGDNIGTSADYTFKGNYAVKFERARPRRNLMGAYGMDFDFRIVSDGTRALDFTVVNTRSAY